MSKTSPFEIHLKLHNSQTKPVPAPALIQFEIHLKLHNSQTGIKI